MHRDQLQSSNLKSVGYDQDELILEIEFEDGEIHQYIDVPQETYQALVASESQGSYYTHYIRGRYEYRDTNAANIIPPFVPLL